MRRKEIAMQKARIPAQAASAIGASVGRKAVLGEGRFLDAQ